MKLGRASSVMIGVVLLSVLITGCVDVSRAQKIADVIGKVVNEGELPVGALVSLGGQTVVTDEKGEFEFTNVPFGQHSLTISVGGNVIGTETIDVADPHVANPPTTVSMDGVTNLIPNPYFKGAPDGPIGWTTTNSATLGESLLFIEDSSATDGWIVVIDDDDSRSYGFKTLAIPARPGVEYTATVMAKAEGNNPRATLYLEFYDEDGDRFEDGEFLKSPRTTSSTWSKVEAVATAPENAVYINVMFYSSGGIVGQGYFYDVKLEVTDGE